MLFVTLAIFFLLKEDPPTRKTAILSGLWLGAASLTRVTGFLLLIAFVLHIFVHYERDYFFGVGYVCISVKVL